MSTSYYQMKDPITDFEIKDSEDGAFINICIGKYWSGSFWVAKEDFRTFLYDCLLDDNGIAPYHGYFGGTNKGATLIINKHLPDETKLISEYGEIFTVAEIKFNYQTIEDKTNE